MSHFPRRKIHFADIAWEGVQTTLAQWWLRHRRTTRYSVLVWRSRSASECFSVIRNASQEGRESYRNICPENRWYYESSNWRLVTGFQLVPAITSYDQSQISSYWTGIFSWGLSSSVTQLTRGYAPAQNHQVVCVSSFQFYTTKYIFVIFMLCHFTFFCSLNSYWKWALKRLQLGKLVSYTIHPLFGLNSHVVFYPSKVVLRVVHAHSALIYHRPISLQKFPCHHYHSGPWYDFFSFEF